MSVLIITADDYGYAPAYDEGIVLAARRGAVDSVSAMARDDGLGPAPLLETGVEIGLHLELKPGAGARAGEEERRRARASCAAQLDSFERQFRRPPAYLDGHHHCHARPGIGVLVAELALALGGVPVRSVDRRQRRLLSCRGVPTADRLLGRESEHEPALPAELAADRLPGISEWVTHPGRPDPAVGSAYDRGRAEDLELLLEFDPPAGMRRAGHAAALGYGGRRGPPLRAGSARLRLDR